MNSHNIGHLHTVEPLFKDTTEMILQEQLQFLHSV